MAKLKGSDIEVTKEDQASINTFSKLYTRKQDLYELVKRKN